MKKLILCMCFSVSLLLFGRESLHAQIGYPPTLSVTAKTENSVTLSWTPVNTVEGYHVFYKPDTLFPPYLLATNAGVTSIVGAGNSSMTVTGLASGADYTFCIYGDTIDIHGNKSYSWGRTCVNTITESKKTVELDFEQAASVVVGQVGPESSDGANRGGTTAFDRSLASPAGVWVTPASGSSTSNGKLIVADAWNNRVLFYNDYPTSNKILGPVADVALGQTSTWYQNSPGTSRGKLRNPSGICTATFGDTTFLIVCDQGNHRVLVYTFIPTVSDTHAAWKVFGQDSWTTGSAGCSQKKMNNPVAVCTYGRKLIIADRDNNRVLIWNNFTDPAAAPFAGNASVVVGRNNFSPFYPPDQCSGQSNKATLSSPYGVAVNRDGKLVIASRLEHRVLIYNNVPTINGDSAIMVLGQPDFSSNCYGYGSPNGSNMGFLRAVSISSQYEDEKLSVIDILNNRILVWNTFPQKNNQPADVVLIKPSLTALYSTPFSNQSGYNLNAQGCGWTEYSCFAPNGDFIMSDAGYSRVHIFPKAAGNMSASNLTVTAVTDSSISISWTGNTKLYKIKFGAGTFDTYAEIDSISGYTYTLSKLRCNTPYQIQVIPRLSNPLRYGTYNGSSVNTRTTAGPACANALLEAGTQIRVTATYGNIIYLAGDFTQINGQSRNGLAAINATTYALLPFNPNVTGKINSMKVSTNGQYLYIAGAFTAVGGTTAHGIAKISTVTGNALSYPSLNAGGYVRHASLTPGTDYWFIMGDFSSVGAETGFSFCAGIDDSDRVITSFKPVIQDGKNANQLRSIAATPDNRYVYIGHGNNETISYKDGTGNMSPRNGLAEFRVSDGKVTAFDPYPDTKGVFDIACTNHALYFCGSFDIMKNSGDAPRRRVVKYKGAPEAWTLDNSFAPAYPYNGPNKGRLQADSLEAAEFRALVLSKNRVYIYGHVSNYAGVPRYGIIALDSGNASLVPEFNLGVNNMTSITDTRMCHSDTLNKIIASVFGTSVSFMSANLYTMDFICGRSDSTTVAFGSDRMVDAAGVVDFSSAQTAVRIDFKDVVFGALMTVERYKDAPQNVSGIAESNYSKYRFVVHKFAGSMPQFSKATVKFKVSAIPSGGITDAASVKVYVRNTYGFGPFRLADSIYYDNTNGEINAVVGNFSKAEFVLASNSSSNPFLQHRTDLPLLEQAKTPEPFLASNELKADLVAAADAAPQGVAAFRLYPNPAHAYVVLSIPFSGQAELQIMDLKGRMMQKASVSNGERLELDKLGKGIYLVRVKNLEDGTWYVQKLAVR